MSENIEQPTPDLSDTQPRKALPKKRGLALLIGALVILLAIALGSAGGYAQAMGTRMNVQQTKLPGVLIIDPVVHRDPRGFFLETYQQRRYEAAGARGPFVQDNCSSSLRGTIRGLHAQRRAAQGKLIRAITGEIFDVAVDIRRGSPTFKRWISVALSGETQRQVYVPPGFAHGFCVVSESALVEYKCTELYDPADEMTVRWDDPELAIPWPAPKPLISPKDRAASVLRELADQLPEYR